MDSVYRNGVIAVREKYLLGERLKRLCESSADDAFRQIVEYGFGGGAEALSSHDFEALIAVEEKAIDEFIKKYTPSKAERDYLMLPRDFHNAEALVKAEYLALDADKMLAPDGIYSVTEITNAIQSGNFDKLGVLKESVIEAVGLFVDEERKPTGVEIGTIFLRGLYRALERSCRRNKATSKLLAGKADMTNLLTAFRSESEEEAKKLYLSGGKLTEKQLASVFEESEKCEQAFQATPYIAFVKACLEARRAGLPYTQAERMRANYEIDAFSSRRFELSGSETFLYYVLRRRLECDDVRILFVCLNAGMKEEDIKKRLRSLREGL